VTMTNTASNTAVVVWALRRGRRHSTITAGHSR